MSSLRVEPIAGPLGACVWGIDARHPIREAEIASLHRALTDRQVLFFRRQDLSAQQLLDLAALFGELAVDPVSHLKGLPKILTFIEDTQDRPPAEFPWHTDLSWLREPPAFGVLNARVIPPRGGDTTWVSLFALYDALPTEGKRAAERLRLLHRPKPHFFETVRRHHGDEITDRLIAENPPVAHPLVRTHPVSARRALYLSPLYADSFVGLPADESRALLARLEQMLDDTRFQVRWQWQEHDLVIWDEASTNHRAAGDHYPQRRRMQRCAVAGTQPYFRAPR